MIPEVNPYNNYRGDGVATLFDYDFFIQNGSQLIVEHIDENDVVTRLEENIDYEIVVIEEEFAGYIKFPIEDSKFGILQENETLSLQLTLPFEQISEYGQSSLLDLNSIEFSLDYLTRLCQILKRQMERSIKVSEGSEATPEELLETINNNALVSTNAAAIASKKADEAMESANFASKKVEEITSIYDEAVEKIETDKSNALDEIEQSSSSGVEELNKIKEETKAFKDELVESGMFKFNLFDTKILDYILTGNEAKGWALQGTYVDKLNYPSFYNKCLEEKNSAVATQTTLNDVTLTMFIHSNGHQFYNLADKEVVDNFYEAYGIADFYGIDEENERIFLPRNKYFAIKNPPKTIPIAGTGNTLGLTNGTQNLALQPMEGGTRLAFTGVYNQPVGSHTTTGAATWGKALGVTTDSSKSGIVAHSTSVIQPNENKYLYYCVGNTVINDSTIDAGALVAQMGNKANIFLDNIIPSQDFKTSVSAYSMPSNKYNDKLELGATGTSYTAPANGWFMIYGIKTTAGYTLLLNTTNGFRTEARTTLNGTGCGCYIPVRKGDVVTCNYDGTYRSDRIWCFYYAEGEQ